MSCPPMEAVAMVITIPCPTTFATPLNAFRSTKLTERHTSHDLKEQIYT